LTSTLSHLLSFSPSSDEFSIFRLKIMKTIIEVLTHASSNPALRVVLVGSLGVVGKTLGWVMEAKKMVGEGMKVEGSKKTPRGEWRVEVKEVWDLIIYLVCMLS
jgi:hypothetical protein